MLEHYDQLIDILDEAGNTIATKQRSEVDKKHDILPGAYVLAFQGGRLFISEIAEHPGQKRLYQGKLGCSGTTLIRHGETGDIAVLRALKNDLGITDSEVIYLGGSMEVLSDGVRRYMHAYAAQVGDSTETFPNYRDMAKVYQFTREEFMEKLTAGLCAPTLMRMWEKYFDQLPF